MSRWSALRIGAGAVLLVATMPILGAFVVTRHPGNRLGWLFCLYGPLRGIEVLADVWVRHTYLIAPGSWPGGSVETWLLSAGPLFLFPTVPLLTLWFPDGHAPPGRWHRAELAPATLAVLLAAVLVLEWPLRGRRLLPGAAGGASWSQTISDEGPGGATLAGSGLRGLWDRVEACGGRLSLASPRGGGTELVAELPCA